MFDVFKLIIKIIRNCIVLIVILQTSFVSAAVATVEENEKDILILEKSYEKYLIASWSKDEADKLRAINPLNETLRIYDYYEDLNKLNEQAVIEKYEKYFEIHPQDRLSFLFVLHTKLTSNNPKWKVLDEKTKKQIDVAYEWIKTHFNNNSSLYYAITEPLIMVNGILVSRPQMLSVNYLYNIVLEAKNGAFMSLLKQGNREAIITIPLYDKKEDTLTMAENKIINFEQNDFVKGFTVYKRVKVQ